MLEPWLAFSFSLTFLLETDKGRVTRAVAGLITTLSWWPLASYAARRTFRRTVSVLPFGTTSWACTRSIAFTSLWAPVTSTVSGLTVGVPMS